MNKVKLFYSYSHKDEEYRKKLIVHLSVLRKEKLIDEWHDRKIKAGDQWDEEIEKNIENSHIILLLFSPDFIASDACQKEMETAIKLKKEKGVTVIPIILKECAWKDIPGICNIQALPKGIIPIKKWSDQDEAWATVYKGIRITIEKILRSVNPKIKDAFRKDLINNPVGNCTLNELFVYPDIFEIDTNQKQKLEHNEIDSEKLKNLSGFKDKHILLEGEEQSGKTSLCNMLYVHYLNDGFCPIKISGKNISGKVELKKIVEHQYKDQYEVTSDYWSIDKEKRILFIDDIEEWSANKKNLYAFMTSIQECFKFSIAFIDKLSNLSDRSTDHNHYYCFKHYSIQDLGHKKRSQLLKKCISHDEHMEFNTSNSEQLARLDKSTKHINTIIGSNIVPSSPLFIVTVFHTVESATPQDASKTSYGHCYHAMIVMKLGRSGIKPGDIDGFLNFLTELAYFMFHKNKKTISEIELEKFSTEYKIKFIPPKEITDVLLRSNILRSKKGSYRFQYIYIYYYFVAKYIAQKMDNNSIVKKQIAELMSNIHMKDNANIIIFVIHHTNNRSLLDDILLCAMLTFDKFPESTLSGSEKNFIKSISKNLEQSKLPNHTHDINKKREEILKRKDKLEPVIKQIENNETKNSNPLSIEIRKSAKNMEIIGQILKNQHGSLERHELEGLFKEGQNVGLRLLKCFIELMVNNNDLYENLIQSRLDQISNKKGEELSKIEKVKESQKIIAQFSYGVIFGWLHKIVDSLGYDKIIEVADIVNDKTGTAASKLINLSIHAWYKKRLDLVKIKSLHHEFESDKNYQAIHLLKDIVSRHIYMHPIAYDDKQKINSLLGFSVKNQISIQHELERK